MRAQLSRFMKSLCRPHWMLGVGAPLVLVACTGVQIIDADVSDYRTSFARASEEQILRNILRARDQLPLHFSELQNINATIQQSASLSATAPFGVRRGSTVRDSLTASVGLQNNPQLSVGTLETQEFTKGILSPIEPKLIKQFVDRGIDPRIILILFFSEVQLPHYKLPVTNGFPCMDFYERECYGQFFEYLRAVNAYAAQGRIRVNVYTELRPVGPPVAATEDAQGTGKTQFATKDVANIDFSKFRIRQIEAADVDAQLAEKKDIGKYQLYSISAPKPVFCSESANRRPASPEGTRSSLLLLTVEDERCKRDEIFIGKGQSPRSRQSYEIRSVYQMIQFLGQILAFQDASAEIRRCIVLGTGERSCDTGDVLFQVNSPRGVPVVSTSYGDARYSLVDGSCQRASPCDHSTQVLEILTMLLNTNKVAKDIPNPAVIQVVQ